MSKCIINNIFIVMCILIYHKSHLDYLDNIDKFIKHRGPDKFNKLKSMTIFLHSLLSIN